LLYRRKAVQGKEVNQLAVPVSLRERVMKLAHESIMSGHQGVKKTYERTVAHFFWPGIHGDVERYCRSCDVCQRTVAKGRVTKVPLGKMPLMDSPFKRVAVDLIGPISPVTERGNRYILTMVDYATRYPEATALKSIEAETVAEALVTMFSRVWYSRRDLERSRFSVFEWSDEGIKSVVVDESVGYHTVPFNVQWFGGKIQRNVEDNVEAYVC